MWCYDTFAWHKNDINDNSKKNCVQSCLLHLNVTICPRCVSKFIAEYLATVSFCLRLPKITRTNAIAKVAETLNVDFFLQFWNIRTINLICSYKFRRWSICFCRFGLETWDSQFKIDTELYRGRVEITVSANGFLSLPLIIATAS